MNNLRVFVSRYRLVGSPVRVGFHANKSTCDELDDQKASKSYHQ